MPEVSLLVHGQEVKLFLAELRLIVAFDGRFYGTGDDSLILVR